MKTILFASLFIIFISCSSPVEPFEDSYPTEYFSLNVGDVRQFSRPNSDHPEIYSLWIISGKTQRSDGVEVFICDTYFYSKNPRYKQTFYYLVRDGYYYSTELEKTNYIRYNPYFEQKLGKLYPKEGERWLQFSEVMLQDTFKYYLTPHFLKEFSTPVRNFKDVCQLTSSTVVRNQKNEDSYIYYTKYYGHIGYSMINVSSSLFVVNYMKIKGYEIGIYVKMPSDNGTSQNFDQQTFITPFGIKTLGEKL